jgi:hypothetical protein
MPRFLVHDDELEYIASMRAEQELEEDEEQCARCGARLDGPPDHNGFCPDCAER